MSNIPNALVSAVVTIGGIILLGYLLHFGWSLFR